MSCSNAGFCLSLQKDAEVAPPRTGAEGGRLLLDVHLCQQPTQVAGGATRWGPARHAVLAGVHD
eukprot:1894501-Amphidinium_carterae.1